MPNTMSTSAPPEPRPAGVWDYISPSRLNLWLKCPLAFRLRYLEGVRIPAPPAAFIGKMVHRGLEVFYRARMAGVALDYQAVQREIVNHWDEAAGREQAVFESASSETDSCRQVQQLLEAYLRVLPATEPAPVAVELTSEAPLVDPFTGESLGIPLLGIMDLVLPDPAGPVLADFKTAARSSAPVEILHEVQLSCYAYLLRAELTQTESALEIRSLIKTKVPKIETSRFAPRQEIHFKRLFAVIRRYLDDLDSGTFIVRPGQGCLSCEFSGARCQQAQL